MPDRATPDAPDLPRGVGNDASDSATPRPVVQPPPTAADSPASSSPTPGAAGGGLGLLGGTFDPPHVGHLVAAATTRAALGLDEVWLVVANEPWQKVGARPITPAADRLAMVQEAVRGIAGVRASACEIERGGSSYTADTLAELRDQAPDRPLFVIVGADAAAGLPTWERADEVRRGATMVLVNRPGVAAGGLPQGWAFSVVEIPRLDLSSTDLRHRVATGQPIDGLTPASVVSLIRERGLYRGPCV